MWRWKAFFEDMIPEMGDFDADTTIFPTPKPERYSPVFQRQPLRSRQQTALDNQASQEHAAERE